MTSHIRQVLKLTISLLLLELFSGCSGIDGPVMSIPAKWGGWPQDNFAWLHMPPQILCAAEDSIGVAYHTTRYDEAMQAITEHCVDGWVETKLVTQRYYRIIYAACLQADGLPAVSPSCKYVAPEQNPVGFGHEDWDSIDR